MMASSSSSYSHSSQPISQDSSTWSSVPSPGGSLQYGPPPSEFQVKYYQHSTLPVILWSPSLSPMTYHNLCLQAVCSRYSSAKGVVLEQGINEMTLDMPVKEEHQYTAEEVYRLRYMIITDRRNAYLDMITNSIIGKKDNHTVEIYADAHVKIFDLVPKKIKTALKKPPGEAVEIIYAITKNLETYNHWLYNEDLKNIQRVLTVLGNAWKKLLDLPAEVLELDDEFSRPAIYALLKKLHYLAVNAPGKFKFKWK